MTAPGPGNREEWATVAPKVKQSLVAVRDALKTIVTELDRLADSLEMEWDVLEAVVQQLEEGSQ